MSKVFLDSSSYLALALGQDRAEAVSDALFQVREVFAANLLAAEVAAALARHGAPMPEDPYWWIQWVHPQASLEAEISRVLSAGMLRGADCWHLAVALSITPDPADLVFLTLDDRQREVARTLGFNVEFPA